MFEQTFKYIDDALRKEAGCYTRNRVFLAELNQSTLQKAFAGELTSEPTALEEAVG